MDALTFFQLFFDLDLAAAASSESPLPLADRSFLSAANVIPSSVMESGKLFLLILSPDISSCEVNSFGTERLSFVMSLAFKDFHWLFFPVSPAFNLSDLSKPVKSTSLPCEFIFFGCSSGVSSLCLIFDTASTEPLILPQFFDALLLRAALRCSTLLRISSSEEDDDDEPTEDADDDELEDGDDFSEPKETGRSPPVESID